MSFSTCKYDRELRFIWSRLNYLKKNMDAGKITGKELAEAKEEYDFLYSRQYEIETTYNESGMSEYLDELKAYCSGPPLEFDDSGYIIEEDEEEVQISCEHPLAQITSINIEIADLDNMLVYAQLNGDDNECKKLKMSIESLKSRRADLIEHAKALEDEDEEEPVETVCDDEFNEVKKDVASLRTQLGVLRSEVMELKGLITQISDYIDIRHR